MERNVNGEALTRHKLLLELLDVVDSAARTSGCRYFMAYGTLLGAVRHKGFIPWDSDVDLYVVEDDLAALCESLAEADSARYEIHTRDIDPTYTKLLPRFSFRGVDHHDVHVDLFPLVGAPKRESMRRLHGRLSYLAYRAFNVKMSSPRVRYRAQPKKRWLVGMMKLLLVPIPARAIERVFQRLRAAVPFEGAHTVRNVCGSYGHREPFPSSWLEDPPLMPFERLELPAPSEWDEYLRQMYGDYEVPRQRQYLT